MNLVRLVLQMLLAVCHLVVFLVATSGAQETKAGVDDDKIAKEITGLVKRLGSTNFAEREEAQKSLLKIGSPAKKQLEAMTKTGDVEVARRIKVLLDAIRAAETADAVSQVVTGAEALRVAKLKNDTATMNRILAENFYVMNQNDNSRNKTKTIELWTDSQD